MAGRPVVYAIGTCDTKGEEITFLAEQLRVAFAGSGFAREANVQIIDVSTSGNASAWMADVMPCELLAFHPSFRDIASLPTVRGQAVQVMSATLSYFLKAKYAEGSLLGAVSIGGSGKTALAAPVLRMLPIGVPKVIVSTVASGNTAPYIDTSDLVLFPSLVDIAGLNVVLRSVLTNAAWVVAGKVIGRLLAKQPRTAAAGRPKSTSKPTVGLTMFGVTTPCVDNVRSELEKNGFETLVFHATATGGRAMESLVRDGFIQGVLDITTTEVADHIVGGALACGPERFDAVLEKGIPLVLSVGALDTVNFGAHATVPAEFKDRLFVEHNAQVTLMRTTPEENERLAKFIARKLNRATGPVRVLLPEKGVSMLDAPGKPFHDPIATRALLDSLAGTIEETNSRKVVKLPHTINDPEFAAALVKAYLEIAPSRPRGSEQEDVGPAEEIQPESEDYPAGSSSCLPQGGQR